MGDPSADWPEVSAGQHELIVTAVSDDQILLPNGNIALAGSGGTRTVTLSPAADQYGSVVITFKVSDGIDQDTATLTLTVNSVNDAPSFIMGDDGNGGGGTKRKKKRKRKNKKRKKQKKERK